MTRRSCKHWKCNLNDKGGISGSIEGGMGYWPYTIVSENSHVKYMLPGSTSSNYEVFGGTMLNDRRQDCTALGGSVRVSNRIIIPNDFVMFEGGDNVDGFLGYMLTKSPIGKRSDTDDANYFTILIDAANFAGPVMYISNWFWDMRTNWDPLSASWSDPRSLLGYIAQGFEGGLGAFSTTKDSKTYFRANRWNLPTDRDSPTTSTLFTGHSQYASDWAASAMEPMLAGTGPSALRTPSYVASMASEYRLKPSCNVPTDENEGTLAEQEGDNEWQWKLGFSKAPLDHAYAERSENASCHLLMEIDTTKFDCTSNPGWCLGRRYLSRDTAGAPGSASEAIHADNEIPADVKATLDANTFTSSRVNDGRYLGPPGPKERPCFECPGPAPQDSKLYCVRTTEGMYSHSICYTKDDRTKTLHIKKRHMDRISMVPICGSTRTQSSLCKHYGRDRAQCCEMFHASKGGTTSQCER